MIENALTVDVEDICHSRYENLTGRADIDKEFLDLYMKELLDFFDAFGAKATFFILGQVASEMPELVKLIKKRGHEAASHGYFHRPVYNLKPEEFKEDIVRSVKTIEECTGEAVLGFRAPCWSITKRSLWALDIIKECGLKYDSSISPCFNFLYGIKGAPREAYWHEKGFWEVPPTTFDLMGKTLIAGGGFYLRALPYFWTKKCISALNRNGKFGLVYLHPHELTDCRTREKVSWKENFILNYNKKSFKRKLIRLLNDFKFMPLKNILGILK